MLLNDHICAHILFILEWMCNTGKLHIHSNRLVRIPCNQCRFLAWFIIFIATVVWLMLGELKNASKTGSDSTFQTGWRMVARLANGLRSNLIVLLLDTLCVVIVGLMNNEAVLNFFIAENINCIIKALEIKGRDPPLCVRKIGSLLERSPGNNIGFSVCFFFFYVSSHPPTPWKWTFILPSCPFWSECVICLCYTFTLI